MRHVTSRKVLSAIDAIRRLEDTQEVRESPGTLADLKSARAAVEELIHEAVDLRGPWVP